MLETCTYCALGALTVGAAPKTVPQPLIDQLAPNGRMFIPVGPSGMILWLLSSARLPECAPDLLAFKPGMQEIIVVDKDADGQVHRRSLMGVSYVPLTDKEAQWSPAASRDEL